MNTSPIPADESIMVRFGETGEWIPLQQALAECLTGPPQDLMMRLGDEIAHFHDEDEDVVYLPSPPSLDVFPPMAWGPAQHDFDHMLEVLKRIGAAGVDESRKARRAADHGPGRCRFTPEDLRDRQRRQAANRKRSKAGRRANKKRRRSGKR